MAISTLNYSIKVEHEDTIMIDNSLRAIQDVIKQQIKVLSNIPYQKIKDSLINIDIIDKKKIGEQIRGDIYQILLEKNKPTSLDYLYEALRPKYGDCVGKNYEATIREYLQMDVFDKKLLDKNERPSDKVFDHMTKNTCYQPKWFRLSKGVYEIIRHHEIDLLKITCCKDKNGTILMIDYDGKRKIYGKSISNVLILKDTF
jgi:hypothetical protein